MDGRTEQTAFSKRRL